jgi:hypothetical protein
MKKLLIIAVALLLGFLMAGAAWYYSKLRPGKTHSTPKKDVAPALMVKLNSRAGELKNYAAQHGYNSDICFLVDMSIESGKNRFFVYDLNKDTVPDAGLVTHGRCGNNGQKGSKYGNDVGCGCTSLGKYKIGKPYKGKFGLAYKLYGLDTTNSNAFKRYVVLHSHACVPDAEIHPFHICRSEGCPTVSPAFLNKLARIIDQSSKPILLYTFDN